MNTSKSLWIAVVVVTIIAVMGLYLPKSTIQTITNTVKGISDSTNFTSIGLGTNDRYVVTTAVRQPLLTATTTPCSILSPSDATTSIVYASLNITTSTSTAIVWELATSTTAYATTSLILSHKAVSGEQSDIVFAGGSDIGVVAPSTYINWKWGGAVVAGTAKLNGYCQLMLRKI